MTEVTENPKQDADPIERIAALERRSVAVRRRMNDPVGAGRYDVAQRTRADRYLIHAWDCRYYAREALRRGDEAEVSRQLTYAADWITNAEKEVPADAE